MRVAERILTSGRMNEADWVLFYRDYSYGDSKRQVILQGRFLDCFCRRLGGVRGLGSGMGGRESVLSW